MTVQSIGLENGPSMFLGSYVKHVSAALGLASGPSTCTVAVVEDTPNGVTFQEPRLGKFYELEVGTNFTFGGIVTKYDRDVRNVSGRAITLNMSDPREIMRSIPMILAPGYRNVAGIIANTNSSCIDVFGAYDDFDITGLNLSGWNQAGVEVSRIIRAFHGGDIIIGGAIVYPVGQLTAKAFGEVYRFNFSEVESRIDGSVRINSNLLSVADFCQELASRNAFDWYVESNRASDNVIDVTIKPIDRKNDNVDIGLSDFLTDNSGYIMSARSGVELRNDIAITCLLGAPVESLRTTNIEGMANEPIDLSSEGGDDKYYMTEMEMRVVLASRQSWETWLLISSSNNGGGGFSRYGGGLSDDLVRPLFDKEIDAVKQNFGRNPARNHGHITDFGREIVGRVFDKLKGHAENSYGKRFVFTTILDSDKIDAAWTIGVVAGDNDADEFFRNDQGKTRCYVEFSNTQGNILGFQVDLSNIFGNSEGQVFPGQAGFQGTNTLTMALANSFSNNTANESAWTTEADKGNWFVDSNGKLFVSATIEDNSNIVRIDAPVMEAKPNTAELSEFVLLKIKEINSDSTTTADGVTVEQAKASLDNLLELYGGHAAGIQIFGRYFQPLNVYVPTRSKYLRYGPVFSETTGPTSEGRLEIEVDDGFCPWEFGGYTVMLDAMQIKCDNQSSTVREVQTADVSIAGFPEFSIGESLGRNSNINNININIGIDGVSTQYQLQSFLRKFGELSKEDLAKISLFLRRGGARNLPQDSIAFIDKYRTRINRQFNGRGTTPSSPTTGGVDSFD
mgnify:CR=1 FL=1